MSDPSKTSVSALRLSEFGFAYTQGVSLLENLNLELDRGSFTLLVGSTGSGKTTLLRSIKPELAPVGIRRGSIRVFDRETAELDSGESATLIGYVSQDPDNQIVCDSVWHELAFGLENLGVASDEMRRRIAEAAYFFGIEDLMHAPAATLSGGQKQAVTLASVLVMQPKLLLLDEPTAQLDPIAEKNFLHALFRINRELGITILVATHAPETMRAYATGAITLEYGELREVELETFNYVARGKVGPSKTPSAILATNPDSPLDATSKENQAERVFKARENPTGDMAGQTQRAVAAGAAPRRAAAPAIDIRDAYFRYRQEGSWVLCGMDLQVSPGSIHAVIGGNGSGKSTLLQAIAGTLKPQRGRIRNALSSHQAFLPQNPKALFVCDSAEEELREWQQRCGYSEETLVETIALFGLGDQLAQHPYDLSGGQQQKLALAKLVLTEPKLLLLDEATKGLDAPSKCELAELLLTLKERGTTMVFATHDLAFTSVVADTASMIFDGETACTEPIAEFFEHNIFYLPEPDGFLLSWHAGNAL